MPWSSTRKSEDEILHVVQDARNQHANFFTMAASSCVIGSKEQANIVGVNADDCGILSGMSGTGKINPVQRTYVNSALLFCLSDLMYLAFTVLSKLSPYNV